MAIETREIDIPVADVDIDEAELEGVDLHDEEDEFRPTPAGWAARMGLLVAVALVVLVLPQFVLGDSEFVSLSLAVIFAVIGISLNVLLGYTGTISLGHQAFVGIGAFTSAYLVSVAGQPFLLGVAAAALVGALQAAVLGGLALRVTGLYFALITLSYGLFAEQTLFGIQVITGGGAGREAPTPTGEGNFVPYYYICLAFLAVVLWVDWRLMRTKGGRALLALRENPRVAATLGIDVRAFTVLGFAVSGAFAGIGGALFAHLNGFVDATEFSFQLALVFILMTVVGGLRNRTGIVIGSAFFALLDLLIRKIPGLEGALLDLETSIPVVAIVVAIALVATGARHQHWIRVGVGLAILALAAVVLSPAEVPLIEPQLNQFPGLTPSIFRLVIGPLLLLATLTLFQGGIGEQIRPIQKWVGGGRFDLHGHGETEVAITDVRA